MGNRKKCVAHGTTCPNKTCLRDTPSCPHQGVPHPILTKMVPYPVFTRLVPQRVLAGRRTPSSPFGVPRFQAGVFLVLGTPRKYPLGVEFLQKGHVTSGYEVSWDRLHPPVDRQTFPSINITFPHYMDSNSEEDRRRWGFLLWFS